VQELARAGEIGRKVDGRWVFTEGEITRLKADRDLHARRLALTSTWSTRRRSLPTKPKQQVSLPRVVRLREGEP
jgi:hypothetical protein